MKAQTSAPSVPETDLYDPIRAAVSRARLGCLFRNHVGTAKHGSGHYVRHGLPGGSSDLVGWTLPGPVHPGGLMLSIEVKPAGWKPSPKWKSDDQAKWIDAVNAAGGVAFVSRSAEETVAVLEGRVAPIYPV